MPDHHTDPPASLPIAPDGTLGIETFRNTINAGVVAQGHAAAWRPPGAPPAPPDPRRLGHSGVDRALDAFDAADRARELAHLSVLGTYIRHSTADERIRQPIRLRVGVKGKRGLTPPKWIDARSALVRVVSTVTPPRDGFALKRDEKTGSEAVVRVSDGWHGQTTKVVVNSPSIDKTWRPQVAPSGHKRRARLYEVQRGIRPIQRVTSRDGQWSRMASCGWALAHGRDHVAVMVTPSTGKARYSGVQTCGSVWECPVCSARIQAGRADEIEQAVDQHWGLKRAIMVTLTVRHGPGDDLEKLRRGLADAWRKMRSGGPWRRIEEAWGIKAYIKALEVTHGPNGWHPHLHVIFLLDRPIAEQRWRKKGGQRYINGASERPEGGDGPPRPYDRAALLWLRRWQQKVEQTMGPEYVPDARRGLYVTPCERSTYLAKFGLELVGIGKSDASTKQDWRRRHGYRTPFEFAAAYADGKGEDDARIWREWCAGIKGARHLTWSRGLKEEAAVRERTDEELATGEDPGGADEALIGHIEADDWRRIRKVYVRPEPQARPWLRRQAAVWLLEQVEDQGARALPGLVAWAVEFGSPYAPGEEPPSVAPG